MEQSTIALIIMVVVIILYATERFPLAVTSILAALAMAFAGIISFSDAFSGLSNVGALMAIGFGVIGEAFFSTGLAEIIGHAFLNLKGLSEKKFIVAAVTISILLSSVLNAMLVVAFFMPLVNALSKKTNGMITRKNTYLPIGIAAVFGGNLTSIGSSSMINASSMLAASYYGKPLTLFQTTILAMPANIVLLLVLLLIGTRLQDKWFDFAEVEADEKDTAKLDDTHHKMTLKMWLVIVDLILCAGACLSGVNYGAAAMLGACFVIITGCIDFKRAVRGVDWGTYLVIAETIGFAEGVRASGAAALIANTILNICGPLGQSPLAMCIVMLGLSTLLSNFMSNNATVGIMVPIALAITLALGANPAVYTMACAIGANLSVSTPIAVGAVTLTGVAGYRFKDYFRFGGLFNMLAFLTTAVVLAVVYF